MGYSLKSYNTSDMVMLLAAYRGEILKNTNNQYDQDELDNLTTYNFMPQFIDAMANSLSIWDNGKQNLDYYKKMSWAVLESSPVYQAQPNKSEIQKVINDDAKNTASAKGEGCN